AEQARTTPDRTAVVFEGTELTYAEFEHRVNALARLLIARGAGPERFVAVAIPRSTELVVALHAVQRAGAAYVPLDLGYPVDRLVYMCEDARPIAIVTTGESAEAVPGLDDVPRIVLDDPAVAAELAEHRGEPVTDAERSAPLRPHHPAYVIYTSGSTGRPKGVVVPH